MGFLSTAFFAFLVVSLTLYHFVARRRRLANAVLTTASFVFYGWWDWRFLLLLVFTTLCDYTAARVIHASSKQAVRNAALAVCLTLNLGTLAAFKYFGFFVDNMAALLSHVFGVQVSTVTLAIGLPIGLSFYTFQAISYVVDVYRRELEPEKDVITYLAYATFFPQLAAGPIERGSHMLPQYRAYRGFSFADATTAVRWLVYGYFLKVFVADAVAPFADTAFEPGHPWGWWVVIGTLAFGMQIYADFCGYSYIARGLALLFGIDLMRNFERPYWALSIQDFWRRWHISLSRWLRDYLYKPLGGNRRGPMRTYANLMTTMLLGGLWHGASWTFVLWGAWHGALLALHRLWTSHVGLRVPPALSWALTFAAVMFGWFLFRVQNMSNAHELISHAHHFTWLPGHTEAVRMMAVLALPVVAVEWVEERAPTLRIARPVMWILLGIACALTYAAGLQLRPNFIYFQF